jgi:hypothetical protein
LVFKDDVRVEIFLDSTLKKTIARGSSGTDESFSFGQLGAGNYEVKVEFNSQSNFGRSKFGQSRFGENSEVVTLPVIVTIACPEVTT